MKKNEPYGIMVTLNTDNTTIVYLMRKSPFGWYTKKQAKLYKDGKNEIVNWVEDDNIDKNKCVPSVSDIKTQLTLYKKASDIKQSEIIELTEEDYKREEVILHI